MKRSIDVDYAIEIDFQKKSKYPERVFFTVGELIKSFQDVDTFLIESIHSKIKPILLLEDIETGSIRAWLKSFLESIDDESIKNMDVKQAVGSYLVKCKYAIVNFLDGKSTITDRRQLEDLETELIEMAKKTDALWVPSYQPINRNKLISGIQSISNAVKPLNSKDKASYITNENQKASFNLDFQLTPETIDELFVRDKLDSKSTVILKVKKPDYLGDSMWGFRHAKTSFEAKITDKQWLDEFQSRKIDVRPGDSVKAEMLTQLNYGYDNELISEKFFIEKIIEVLPMPIIEQLNLE